MGIIDSFKKFFSKEGNKENPVEESAVSGITYQIDEEDRIVVALIASAMAAEDKPDSEFHISKITRTK